jgi:hypothetical protein
LPALRLPLENGSYKFITRVQMEDTIPLASSCNLREADLSATDLSGADLSEANLLSASLFAANLSEANLTWAGTEAKSAPASEIRRNLFMINP